jgi:hypothetical protein
MVMIVTSVFVLVMTLTIFFVRVGARLGVSGSNAVSQARYGAPYAIQISAGVFDIQRTCSDRHRCAAHPRY